MAACLPRASSRREARRAAAAERSGAERSGAEADGRAAHAGAARCRRSPTNMNGRSDASTSTDDVKVGLLYIRQLVPSPAYLDIGCLSDQ